MWWRAFQGMSVGNHRARLAAGAIIRKRRRGQNPAELGTGLATGEQEAITVLDELAVIPLLAQDGSGAGGCLTEVNEANEGALAGKPRGQFTGKDGKKRWVVTLVIASPLEMHPVERWSVEPLPADTLAHGQQVDLPVRVGSLK